MLDDTCYNTVLLEQQEPRLGCAEVARNAESTLTRASIE